jgi:hypothetical protein
MLENVCGGSEVTRESTLLDGIMGSGSGIRVLHRSRHTIFRTGQNRTAEGIFADRFQYFAEVNTDTIIANSYVPVEYYIRNVGLTPITGLGLRRRGSSSSNIEFELAGEGALRIYPGQSRRFTAFVPVGYPVNNFEYRLTATFESAATPYHEGTVWFALPSISILPFTRNNINSNYVNGWEFALGLMNEGTARLAGSTHNVRLGFFLAPTFQPDSRVSSITISDSVARGLMDTSMYSHIISRAAFEAGRIHTEFATPSNEIMLFIEATVVDQNGERVPEMDYRFNRLVVSFELTECEICNDTGCAACCDEPCDPHCEYCAPDCAYCNDVGCSECCDRPCTPYCEYCAPCTDCDFGYDPICGETVCLHPNCSEVYRCGTCEGCPVCVYGCILGDIDGNGRITSRDVTWLLRWANGDDVQICLYAADFLGTGLTHYSDLPVGHIVRLARWLVGHNVEIDLRNNNG